ncbi:MAG TPA: hypothetical protein VGM50_23035 [Gemmatimonadaceae bacterium]|jgi:hypothetical protein
MFRVGTIRPNGTIGLTKFYADPFRGRVAHHLLNILILAFPRPGLETAVNVWRIKNLPNIWRGLWRVWTAELLGISTHYGALYLRRKDGRTGRWVEYGIASLRVITTVGAKYICDDIAGGANDSSLFKFHGFGTGTTAEAVGDTALVTELTTEYNPNSTRPTGSQSSATVSTNATYTTVATLTPDSGTPAVTEHMVASQAATGGGTCLDRSKFAAVNLDSGNGDSLQGTYVLTMTAGS